MTERKTEMLSKTKWILAGGAAAVALTPVAAFASGFGSEVSASGVVVESAQSGSLLTGGPDREHAVDREHP
jgi:anti-sigma factor RsiW